MKPKNWKNTIILVFEKVTQLVARALVAIRTKKISKSKTATLTFLYNLKKKHTKTLSNSAELHFDNYAISYKELDLSINLKKKLKTGCSGIPLNCSIVIPICPYYQIIIFTGVYQ